MEKGKLESRIDELTQDIQNRFGILLGYKELSELLLLKSGQGLRDWVKKNGLQNSGRKGHYYSRDVARAIACGGEAEQ